MNLLKRLFGSSPSATDHFEHALASEQKAYHANALRSLSAALGLDPQYADAFYLRGLIFEVQEDHDNALMEFETVRRLQPSTIESLAIEDGPTPHLKRVARSGPRVEYLVRWMFGDEGSPDAETISREAIANDIARNRLKRGMRFYTEGQLDQAIVDFTEVLQLNPGDTRTCLLRGRAYGTRGRFKEAIADLRQAVSEDPPAVQLMLGNCYKEIGDHDGAIEALSAAIRLERSNPHVYVCRAIVWHLKQEPDKAIADYSEALRLDPRTVLAYEGRADAYRKIGANDRAQADEQAARTLLQDADRAKASLPPSAQRVAARALVLSAVIYRAEMESDRFGDAESWRKQLLRWVDALDLGLELEPGERDLLHAPVGVADKQAIVNAYWRASGLGVLAWALHRIELPAYDQNVDLPRAVARLGFSEEFLSAMDTTRARDLVQMAGLRPAEDINHFASHITIVSWRLRQFQLDPDRMAPSIEFDVQGAKPVPIETSPTLRKHIGPGIGERMDFVAYLRQHPRFKEEWLNGLRLIDRDLAIGDTTLAEASVEEVQRCTSNAVECQIAAYWLQGDDRTYSNVNPSTLLSGC
jgi:tetratricopeptide (TPR) repeat protein